MLWTREHEILYISNNKQPINQIADGMHDDNLLFLEK